MLLFSRLLGESVVIHSDPPVTLVLVQTDPANKTATFDVRQGGRVTGVTIARDSFYTPQPGVAVTVSRVSSTRIKIGIQSRREVAVHRGEVDAARKRKP